MNFRATRLLSSLVVNSYRRIRWLTSTSRTANCSPFKIHLLVVKQPIYAKLARTCVESFLYFHPNTQVIIHCDQVTLNSLKRAFRILKLLRRRVISLQLLPNNDVWQMNKLKIILDISGTQEIFMDCDLRWNGLMSNEKDGVLCYFVKEKYLTLYEGMAEALTSNLQDYLRTSMKNTSYFTWSGANLDHQHKLAVIEMYNQIMNLQILKNSPEFESIKRISEQIVLSIMPEQYSLPFKFLKNSDRQFDGTICESSYYGASGGRFAIWGNTNRKFLF